MCPFSKIEDNENRSTLYGDQGPLNIFLNPNCNLYLTNSVGVHNENYFLFLENLIYNILLCKVHFLKKNSILSTDIYLMNACVT